ncbi:hypothetical protein SAMN05421641_10766 [Paracoccus thiocyanatus]|uniref:Uncharacterized protein n=1 Tax=Paracoccus thiocyanatus TaxID=34006 RepID=A0A1N6SDF8_9RHOB|nr:hypothetical protein SAMN05421641_10766 [Paracoccus thiocyanatus]
MAESLNGKNTEADVIRFTLPGFINIDDPALLAQLLAEYIKRVRKIDAADRAASGKEE